VEVALKMAVQFWKNQNKNSQKSKFLHFTHSYHGDTMGTMSVSDGRVMHGQFSGHVPMQFKVNIPLDELGFEDFEALLEDYHKQLAGVIIEPLVQCAGGMKFHSADVLAEIHRIVKKFDLLFIADEVATGFGRTGYMFACEEAGIVPDIMCVGKALTGGVMTLAATCTSAEVFAGFEGDEADKAFMHGPTYMGNALACAVANASLDLFESEPRLEQVQKIEEIMLTELAKCEKLAGVKDVRVKGALGVVELQKSVIPAPQSVIPAPQSVIPAQAGILAKSGKIPDSASPLEDDRFVNMQKLREEFIARGVFIRPFGNFIYLAPPFVISETELKKLCDAVFEVLG
jgi:adenosylmethionine-8-amino-7-oxononanoate aminotransferase